MKPKNDDLRPEYSAGLIQSGVRGRFAKQYREQTNIVVVDADLTKEFPNERAVNDALREYLEIRKKAAG